MQAVKASLRKWVLGVLRFLAKKKLNEIQPGIIGVTGSAGKTSAKDLIADVLGLHFKVKKSEKNMNTEFGLALTILNQKTGYSSLFRWFGVLIRSVAEAFKVSEKYELLVMEMGVDKPGDMDEILRVVRPHVMVFLNVKNVHVDEDQFANRQDIFDEKSKACYAVPEDGWCVLNCDDNFVMRLNGKLPCNTITIGTDGVSEEEDCDLFAKDVRTTKDGLYFVLAYEDKELPVHIPKVLGRYHVPIALAAIAVGFIHGLPWKIISGALGDFELPHGRMNKIEGKHGALIIDSSYNASPDTMEAALEVLADFPGRKIAALGTMNELGELTESAHLKIGKAAAEAADMLLAVGEHAKYFAEGARRAGMSASMIHTFENSREAGHFLAGILEKHDTVLAKGSQNNVRMEHLVKVCMAEPEQARHLLVRQEPYWLTNL